MKLFISADIEGVAGVVHWDQIMSTGPDYDLGRRLLIGEVEVLCRAAVLAGVEEITVNDAHSHMRNLLPDQLDERVRLITGHFKPMYMMEGLDESFTAAVFLGYHGPAGSTSVLSHTYNPRVIWEARIDGQVTGETGINALVAHHFGVPIILVTGDERTVEDAGRWTPEAIGVAVKHSVSRFAAESVTPERARQLIFEAAKRGLAGIPAAPKASARPISLELILQSADMAALAEWVGARRTDERRVVINGANALNVYRTFHALLLVARAVLDA